MNGPITLWAYGSNARGDSDATSDFDVLSVADFPVSDTEIVSKLGVRELPLAISRYSWSEVYGMA